MSRKDNDTTTAQPALDPSPRANLPSAREMYEKLREESERQRASATEAPRGPGGAAYGGLEGGAHLQEAAPGGVRHHANPATYANLENGYTPVAPGQSRTSGPASYDAGLRASDPYADESRPPLSQQFLPGWDTPQTDDDITTPVKRDYFVDPGAAAPRPVAAQPVTAPAPVTPPAAAPAPSPIAQASVVQPPVVPVPAAAPAAALQATVAPGWYLAHGALRWHDGVAWTEHVHPLPPPPLGY